METESFRNRCFPVRRFYSSVLSTHGRVVTIDTNDLESGEDFATYPAIVEISTAADRQSGFRLHRVRQRDLKSFGLMNRIFGG